jgi:hypothetical protein
MDLLLILWCVELSVLLLSFLLIICASYSALVRVPHVLNYAMLLAQKLIIAVRYVSLNYAMLLTEQFIIDVLCLLHGSLYICSG